MLQLLLNRDFVTFKVIKLVSRVNNSNFNLRQQYYFQTVGTYILSEQSLLVVIIAYKVSKYFIMILYLIF